jgi:hypothetical protein
MPKLFGLTSANSRIAVDCSSPAMWPSLAISIETTSTCFGVSLASKLAAASSGRLASRTAALRSSEFAMAESLREGRDLCDCIAGGGRRVKLDAFRTVVGSRIDGRRQET